MRQNRQWVAGIGNNWSMNILMLASWDLVEDVMSVLSVIFAMLSGMMFCSLYFLGILAAVRAIHAGWELPQEGIIGDFNVIDGELSLQEHLAISRLHMLPFGKKILAALIKRENGRLRGPMVLAQNELNNALSLISATGEYVARKYTIDSCELPYTCLRTLLYHGYVVFHRKGACIGGFKGISDSKTLHVEVIRCDVCSEPGEIWHSLMTGSTFRRCGAQACEDVGNARVSQFETSAGPDAHNPSH